MSTASADVTQVHLTIGQASTSLTGPWKFQSGDDLRWAAVDFDDSSWEDVDLSAPPGARDDDVGLPGYVPGWASRGHAGYYGYAWYRLYVTVSAPRGETLALVGPLAVDSAYQLYVNGRLMGGVGDFSAPTPTARSYHRPALFIIPADLASADRLVVAIRVWLGTWARSSDAGGMHVAPIIGSSKSITKEYHLQWLLLFEAYIVDALEGLALLLLGLMALSLIPFDRANRSYVWLAIALLFLAIHRGNQAIMFLGNFETVHEFELCIIVLAIPLYMGAWIMAWRSWLSLETPIWLTGVVAGLTALYILAAFLTRSWFRSAFPDVVFTDLHYVINCVRYALLIVYAAGAYQGVRRSREGWYALPAMVVLGVGLYGQELFYLGTPGIWFPFGIGLSLSEVAYALFAVLFALLLLQRLWSFSLRAPSTNQLRSIERRTLPG
jgi:hypothetical protein